MADDEREHQQGSPTDSAYEWATYSAILPESKGQLERWLGSTALASFRGKRVMDVGCGMGRNPYWYVEAGAASVLGVDMDDGSLAAARQNLAPFANARVEKRSAHELDPGGARHLRSRHLHRRAAPPRRPRERAAADVELRRAGRRPGAVVLRQGGQPADAAGDPVVPRDGLAACRSASRTRWRRGSGCSRGPSSGLPFRTDYYRRLRTLSFQNVESIIFDQMLPHIAHYWTRADMERLAGLLAGGTPAHRVRRRATAGTRDHQALRQSARRACTTLMSRSGAWTLVVVAISARGTYDAREDPAMANHSCAPRAARNRDRPVVRKWKPERRGRARRELQASCNGESVGGPPRR